MIEKLAQSIAHYLSGLPKGWITLILAMLPISELRGAIPVAILSLHQPLFKTLALAIFGNLIPVIPLLLFLEPVSNSLRRFRFWRGFFEWLFNRTRKRAEVVQRYEVLGLVLFVAIPLPITGAWTGCVAASLFKIKFRYAFSAIAAGVIIAAFIVTIITLGGKGLIQAIF